MTREEILKQVNTIFCEIFDDDSIVLQNETTSADIDDWDSLIHVTIIVAIEQKFGIHFTMGEVASMKNVGAMIDLIMERI